MPAGLTRILTLSFGKEGNEAHHLGNGWSADEPGYRWMIGQASDIWLSDPGQNHDLILELDVGTAERVDGGPQRMLVGVRNQAVAQISVEKGGTLGFHIPARLLAAPGPVRLLFVHPDFTRPSIISGNDDRDLSFCIHQVRLSRVQPRPSLVAGQDLPPAEMVARFESLGDNCEFGLVQRKLGAEPLGLLRFSYIELAPLIRGLRSGFSGMGDDGTTEVELDDREYVVRESAYGTTYHTFQYEDQIGYESVRNQQTTRLRFLRRKLVEDVTNGEKIYVIKRDPPLRPEEVLPVYAALNEPGMNWLLWVVPADAKHPPGSVEILLPGLARGYIERFAPYENAHDIAHEPWVRMCATVWRAVGGMVGQSLGGQDPGGQEPFAPA